MTNGSYDRASHDRLLRAIKGPAVATEDPPAQPPGAPSLLRRLGRRKLRLLPIPAVTLAAAIVAVNLIGDPPRAVPGDHTASAPSVQALPPVGTARPSTPLSAAGSPSNPPRTSGGPSIAPSDIRSATPGARPPASTGRPAVQQTIRYEAEQAAISGGRVETDRSGTRYVSFDPSRGASLRWSLRQPVGGRVTLRIRYANGDRPDRPMQVSIDGRSAAQVDFFSTGGWSDWRTTSVVVTLPTGTGTIRISTVGQRGGPNLDYLEIAP